MSKLVKKLRQIYESVPPMGFGTASSSPGGQMLLVVALPQTGNVVWLPKAEVDAVLVHSHDLEQGIQTFRQVANNIGDIPWGLWLSALTEEDEEGIKQLKEAGGDFLVLEAFCHNANFHFT